MRVMFTRDMGHYRKGGVYDLPRSLAMRALRINRAVRHEEPEAAVTGPLETAARRVTRLAARQPAGA